jgi:hypothetical protein
MCQKLYIYENKRYNQVGLKNVFMTLHTQVASVVVVGIVLAIGPKLRGL